MEGYVDLISDGGIKKKIVTNGTGATPSTGQTVAVHYAGRLESNGKEFDSSDDPFKFKLGVGQVIKGWDVGVASMKIGETCELYIKSDYAYGNRGAGGVIPPKATLIFKVSLLEIL
jgi:peptidylprolyl isomerase